MDENTTFDTIDEDVINCDAEVMEDESDDSEGCGLGAVAGLVGCHPQVGCTCRGQGIQEGQERNPSAYR